jgi:hypothetical protein
MDMIRKNGFLVIQGHSATAPWQNFYESEKEAESAAKEMLKHGYSMTIIPAVRITTTELEQAGR